MENKKVQLVPHKFIDRGIKKYEGEIDDELLKLIESAAFNFIPYRFKDGRYLLVQPDIKSGFLYPDRETVYKKLVLD